MLQGVFARQVPKEQIVLFTRIYIDDISTKSTDWVERCYILLERKLESVNFYNLRNDLKTFSDMSRISIFVWIYSTQFCQLR